MSDKRVTATAACLKAAAADLARRGLLLAAALAASAPPLVPDAHDYLGVRPHPGAPEQLPLAPAACAAVASSSGRHHAGNRGRIALFGVTDPGYLPR